MEKFLDEVIKSGIRQKIDLMVKAEIEETKKRIEARLPELAASVSLDVMKYINMEQQRDELVIHVKLSK